MKSAFFLESFHPDFSTASLIMYGVVHIVHMWDTVAVFFGSEASLASSVIPYSTTSSTLRPRSRPPR